MKRKNGLLTCCLSLLTAGLSLFGALASAHAADKKPNVLVIWGDDIGQFNISAYNRGMMGYRTPNIDRIATEGALFTDWYGQWLQSFKEFPPRQKPGTFNLDRVMEAVSKPQGSGN